MANGSEKGEGESPFPSLSIHLRKKGGERQTDAAAIFSQSGERREVFSPLSILRRQFLFAREGGHFRKEAPNQRLPFSPPSSQRGAAQPRKHAVFLS